MSKKRISINGFGRIGRLAFRIMQNRNDVEVVAINDLTDVNTLAHLLKYDSVHGKLTVKFLLLMEISQNANHQQASVKKPADLPWGKLSVDVVVESMVCLLILIRHLLTISRS